EEFPQIASHITGFVAAASVAPELTASEQAEPRPSASAGAEPVSPQPPVGAAPSVTPPMPPIGALALLDASGDMRPLEEIEADAIRFAIAHYRGQMSEVARRLRIGRSTLYRKLDSLGLAAGPPDEETTTL